MDRVRKINWKSDQGTGILEAARKILNETPARLISSNSGLSRLYVRQLRNGSKILNNTAAEKIVCGAKKSDTEKDELIVNLPEVKLFVPKFSKTEGDEEVALLLCSDGHAGKITNSFDKMIYKERMEEVFQSTMKLINLHRHMYPIRKLVIANLGDNIQGENPFQGSKIGNTECGARDQVKYIAAPAWNDSIGSFKQQFDEVVVECVPGNHGKDKLAPETSSYDLLLYDILQAGIGREKGITINCHDQWYSMFSIYGFRFLMFHGDGIPCQSGIPFFAIDKALKSWYMQFHGFNYALSGHFHKSYHNEVGSGLEHFMNGTLVSDDDWVLKTLKISSQPSQTLLGIHPKYGVTWRYSLVVDDEFLPEPRDGKGE